MPTPTLAQANKIIEVALARARDEDQTTRRRRARPVRSRSLQREDGASMFRCDIAVGKAWASVGMGVASRTLLQRAKDKRHGR
jgi:uncharacterized protein GlcG (DUF336 family)